jgi:hypothetical protein
MIRILLARALARLSGACDRASTRLYRVQSGIEARRAVRLGSENHTARTPRRSTTLAVTYAPHHEGDEGER